MPRPFFLYYYKSGFALHVISIYLQETLLSLHGEVADFFMKEWKKVEHAKRHVNKFKIAHELMFQLEQAHRFPALATFLSDIEVFATLEPVTVARFEMMRSWGELTKQGHPPQQYFLEQMKTFFSVCYVASLHVRQFTWQLRM